MENEEEQRQEEIQQRRQKLNLEKSKLVGEISFIRKERRAIIIPHQSIAFQFRELSGGRRPAVEKRIREDKRIKKSLGSKIIRRNRRIGSIDKELGSGLL